jgi:hypothetical protein
VRDTDLDTLERLVSVITWGDIEAEDTRHLSEGNFVKVFRLAQLLLEYLLYVQENLKFTNGVLEHGRCVQAVGGRRRCLPQRLLHGSPARDRRHRLAAAATACTHAGRLWCSRHRRSPAAAVSCTAS